MEIHNPQYALPSPLHSTQPKYLDTPELIHYPTSSSREDPLHSPALHLLAEVCDMPQRFPPSKENAPPSLASCSSTLGYSKSPLARFAAMPTRPTPKYHSRRPEVVQLLEESAKSPNDASPLSSDCPSWVIVVAALSLYHHPSYPAHLAFWRPDMMNNTAEFIDTFLSSSPYSSFYVAIHPDFDPTETETREARFLETLEDWIDAEFALYTLRGHQRAYHPHLYDPVTGGRILRKRKAKEIDPEFPQTIDEAKPKRRTKRARKTKVSDSAESTTEPNSSPLVDSILSPPVDVDLEVPSNVPSTSHVSSPESPSSSPDLLNVPTRATKHRRRSSSMTSSGVSGVTLIDSEGADAGGSREASPADTAVDSEDAPDAKVFEKVRSQVEDSTKKLDADTLSVSSALSPLESTPPPPPRRSARSINKTTTQTLKRPPTTSRSRSKRAPA